MMTSLQKQLAAIAVTSTHELDLKAQKIAYSKSLLFEPQVASRQSLDTLLQVCYEGFQELCALDSRFNSYERNLFSIQSLREDRTQLTRKENDHLDVILESFLGLVGSRLLLKPAMKAIEWLVRRFQIHVFNVDFTVLTFLPYHELPIFVTLLSILPKQLSPHFKFLHPYMNSFKNPPRAAIVHTSIHNAAFQSKLNQFVLKISRAGFHYSTLLSFWASISTQMVDGILQTCLSGRQNVRQQREEDFLTVLLPIINEALSIKNVPELALGCYIIITVVATKTNLDERTIDALMLTIVSTMPEDLQRPGISCLSVLANSKQVTNLPKLVCKTLSRLEQLSETLSALSAEQSVQTITFTLAMGFLDRLEKDDCPKIVELIEFAFTSVVLSNYQKRLLLKRLFMMIEQDFESLEGNLRMKTAFAGILAGARRSLDMENIIRESLKEDSPSIKTIENALGLTLLDFEDVDMEATSKAEVSDKSIEPYVGLPDTLLSSIEDVVVASSFLDPTASSCFQRLLSVFSQLATSPDAVRKFQHLPSLQLDHIRESPFFLSFFVYICINESEVATKLAALRILESRVSELDDQNLDLQALIPHTIIALSHSNIKIRRKTADLLLGIQELIHQQRVHSKDENIYIWGTEALYGDNTSKIAWMKTKESSMFIENILCPNLEECVSDPIQVSQVLRSALDSAKNGNEKDSKSQFRPKKPQRAAIFKFLCSHVDNIPIPCRATYLSVLNETKKISGQPRSKYLLPNLRTWSAHPVSYFIDLEFSGILELDKQYLAIVRPADSDAISFLVNLVTRNDEEVRPGLRTAAYTRLGKLWPLLEDSKKRLLAVQLLHIAVSDGLDMVDDHNQREALAFIRKVQMSSYSLVALLEAATQGVQPDSPVHKAKRRRTSFKLQKKPDVSRVVEEKAFVRKLTVVLEIVDGSKHEADTDLFQALFGVIQIIQDFKSHAASDLGYLQVLTISNLLSIMEKLQGSSIVKLDASLVRTDLIVECVRKTPNPDVRNSALLLLGAFAKYAPQSILNSIMPIFTLMTATTVHQGDEYSAHVVDETVREVIPLLAATLRKQNKDLVSAVAEILQSFAAAFKHIPAHRRLRLFALLTESIGPEESLFALIAILINRHPEDLQVRKFACTLLCYFSATEAMISISKYLALIIDGLAPKPELTKILLIRNMASDTEIDPIADLLNTLPSFLEDHFLSSKLNQALEEQPDFINQIRPLFGTMMSQIFQITKSCIGHQVLGDTSRLSLRSLINLLPSDIFVDLVAPLLDDQDDIFRRDLLMIIRDRLDTQKGFNKNSQHSTISLLSRLTKILKESENVALKSAAIACIDQVANKVGKLNTKAVFEAAEVVSGEATLTGEAMLPVLALHCLASMVEVLQNEFIPLVSPLILLASRAMRSGLRQNVNAMEVHNAAQSFFTSIMTHVSIVVAEKPLCLLLELCHESAVSTLGEVAFEARSNTLLQIAMQMGPKPLFSALDTTLESAFGHGYDALREHLETVKLAIETKSKSIVTRSAPKLFELFLKAFDLRHRRSSSSVAVNYTDEQVEILEMIAIDTLMTMIFKINDATLRPFFARYVTWATQDMELNYETSAVLRLTTLFNFVRVFSERLKSIVTAYYSYLLDLTVKILEHAQNHKTQNRLLWKNTLMALESFIRYDQDDFWQSPARFNTLLKPLMSQLERALPQSHESIAIATIVEFAGAAGSNDHLREFNSILGKLAKAESPKIRLAVVRCQKSLTEKLGDEWLNLLPEMLPVINELQEDDDEDVEGETLRWIKIIEGILGESLDSMLQ